MIHKEFYETSSWGKPLYRWYTDDEKTGLFFNGMVFIEIIDEENPHRTYTEVLLPEKFWFHKYD